MGTSTANLISALATVAVLGGLVYLVLRIEPHWVSKDGRRFICRGQLLDSCGTPNGTWQEYRFTVNDDGLLEARRRGVFGARPVTTWQVQARSPDRPRRRAIFLLSDTSDADQMLAIRLPVTSRAVPVVDDVVGR